MRGFRINCLKCCKQSPKDIHDTAFQVLSSSLHQNQNPKSKLKVMFCHPLKSVHVTSSLKVVHWTKDKDPVNMKMPLNQNVEGCEE